MLRRTVAGLALWAAMAGAAWAQEQVWIQVELLPDARPRAAVRRGAMPSSFRGRRSRGFYVGSGWYSVALGPYSPEEAQAVMANLQAEGVIPGEAVILDGASSSSSSGRPRRGRRRARAAVAAPEPQAPAPDDSIPEETFAEAQASEAALSRPEKEQLQVALEWAGVYQGGIDGDFGPGRAPPCRPGRRSAATSPRACCPHGSGQSFWASSTRS
jgi:hypothetical protein